MSGHSDGSARTVAFLLGAGCSVEAGIPATKQMVQAFRAWTKREESHKLLDAIVNQLGPNCDVEAVLEAIAYLSNPSETLNALFAPRREFKSRHAASKLQDDLQNYIRGICMPSTQDVSYLSPLWRALGSDGDITIFSFNYDVCVELSALANNRNITDGFSGTFDLKRLEQPISKLVKLHGSVTWYANDRVLLSLPIKDFQGTYLNGMDLSPVILYPGSKDNVYAEPYSELHEFFKRSLRDKVSVLVSIGYSFRDQDVFYTVGKWLSETGGILVLVDPDSNLLGDLVMRFGTHQVIAYPYRASEFLQRLDRWPGWLLSQFRQVASRYLDAAESVRTMTEGLASSPVQGDLYMALQIGAFEVAVAILAASELIAWKLDTLLQELHYSYKLMLAVYCGFMGYTTVAEEVLRRTALPELAVYSDGTLAKGTLRIPGSVGERWDGFVEMMSSSRHFKRIGEAAEAFVELVNELAPYSKEEVFVVPAESSSKVRRLLELLGADIGFERGVVSQDWIEAHTVVQSVLRKSIAGTAVLMRGDVREQEYSTASRRLD